ncbi:MAG: hypothetical protein Q8O67_13540 [Deltaproteobacteria bacterium]|nr:hypothetical protein [Deltaproteobacteria bacterium]
MEETQRQNLVTSFNNVLRTSALVGVVDLQRAAMAFSALIERNPEGQNLALGPLYDFLLEQKAPEPAVREVLVFVKSREDRFGIKMDLPPQLKGLSEEDRNKLVLAFTSRGASSGTVSGQKVDPSKFKKPSSPGTSTAANELVAGPPTTATTTAAATAATTTATPAAPPAPPKLKKADFDNETSVSSTKKLAIVAVVLGLVLVANLTFNVATAEPPPVELKFNDPAGLPCLEAKGSTVGPKGTVVCRVSKAFADTTPQPVVDAKGAVTAAAARALGYHRVLVFSLEDSSLRWVF